MDNPLRWRFGLLVGLLVVTLPAGAQKHYPPISARTFDSGSVQITVTGAFTMDTKVMLNKPASFGDGEMTWVQFGTSGATTPNALFTFTTMGEVGIQVAQGTLQAVAGIGGNEQPWCTGKLEVKPKLVTGDYTCVGAASHDTATGKMGKVTVTVKFTAGS